MARFVVAGGGVVGAAIAYNLAAAGADSVVLAELDTIASGATGKALGGVRQQFSSAPEVRLARESIAFFRTLGAPLFEPVGYLFLATTPDGLSELEKRREVQCGLGVPVVAIDPLRFGPLVVDDVLGATFCAEDGTADPSLVTRELVRRAADLGVEIREGVDALAIRGERLVIACGAQSVALAAHLGVTLPIRPLVRQLLETARIPGIARDLPLTVEVESGFHFRRKGDGLVVAIPESAARWSDQPEVDTSLLPNVLRRLARRYPAAADVAVARVWAGLYDMTPDAHPIIGEVADGVYVACGFSGHGFMQAPAVGAIVAAELLGLDIDFDLAPYRLGRFAAGAVFPETAIL
jgi:sarcosine oxidase, subunit beta